MRDLLYRYAFDENGNQICVDEISKGNKGCHRYSCISCGCEMTVKLGDIRKHHFAHVINKSCNSETYIHKLSKSILKKRFETSENFYVDFKQKTLCDKSNFCPWSNDLCSSISSTYDLKKWYDTCTIEANYKGFVADLLLESSINPEIEPIMLEIYVTHHCTQDKIDSQIKIIEFKVRDEYEAEKLSNLKIVECRKKESRFQSIIDPDTLELEEINFYNFKRESIHTSKDFTIFNWGGHLKVYKAQLRSSGVIDYEISLCRNIEDGFIDSNHIAVAYIACHEDDPSKKNYYVLNFFAQKRCIINCQWCEYCKYNKTFKQYQCNLYKKYGLPQFPIMEDAYKCEYYRVFDEISSTMTEFHFPKQMNNFTTITI